VLFVMLALAGGWPDEQIESAVKPDEKAAGHGMPPRGIAAETSVG
jgi:hypothetical protein